jgi:hypothetical protein
MPNAPSLCRTRGLAAAACCRAAWHSAGSLWPLRAVVADFRWPTCTARCGCRPTCIPKCRTCAAAAAAQHPLDDHQARDATRTPSPQPPSIHIDVIEPLVLSSWRGSLRCRTFLEPSSNLPRTFLEPSSNLPRTFLRARHCVVLRVLLCIVFLLAALRRTN